MTIDYTKPSAQKTKRPLKVEEIQSAIITHIPAKPHALDERICTQCYWLGKPRIIESGSWLGYILPWFFDEPVTLYGCRECNYPSSMVPVDSHEGKQAMYWYLKRNNPQASPGPAQF